MADRPAFRLEAIAVVGPGSVTLDGTAQSTITSALAAARPGSIIELGRGRFAADTETFPLHIPAEVTLRGPIPPSVPREARKHLPPPQPAEIVGAPPLIEVMGDDVEIAHVTLRSTRPEDAPVLHGARLSRFDLDTCAVVGTIDLDAVASSSVAWTSIDRGKLVLSRCTSVRVVGGLVSGGNASGRALSIDGGVDVRLEAVTITEAKDGVTAVGVDGLFVGGCGILTDDVGVCCRDVTGFSLSGNRFRGSRPIRLVDCTDGDVSANGIQWRDAAIETAGCVDVRVERNHLEQIPSQTADRSR